MAARSIATLTVSFGMVSIPVKLFSATEASRAISFNLLHKSCGSRLKQQYICVKEEVAVGREHMAKGYEFEKDQYVMFSPEELKALEEAGTHTADVAEFVPVESIDPVYFDKAYYLAPDKGGAKPYALLTRALRESGRRALAPRSSTSWRRCVRVSTRRRPRHPRRRPTRRRTKRPSVPSRRSPSPGKSRKNNTLCRSARNAPVRCARRRAAASAAPQHDPEPGQRRFRFARTRPAQVVPVLVPGSDRAANRAGARCGEGPAQADHEVLERASPPSPRRHAAIGPRDRRSRRPRGRLRRREPLAGGIGAVSARLRRRSGRRLPERGRAQRRRRSGERGRLVRARVQARGPRFRGRAGSLRARARSGSDAPGRPHQPGKAPARSRPPRRCGTRLSRGDLGLRQRSPAALQPRRSAGGPGPQERGDGSLREGAAPRSAARGLSLQPRAPVQDSGQAQARDPAHGAVSKAGRAAKMSMNRTRLSKDGCVRKILAVVVLLASSTAAIAQKSPGPDPLATRRGFE